MKRSAEFYSVFKVNNTTTYQSSADKKSRKYVYLDEGHYVSLSKKLFLNEVEGILTEEVCECVFGYLVGPTHVFAFHFSRKNDPEHLLEEILKIFSPGDSLQIFLISGGFNNLAYPWNLAKRNLIIDNIPINPFSSEQIAIAKKRISYLNRCGFDTEIGDFDFVELLEKCSVECKNGFLQINFDLLDQVIKSKNFIIQSSDNNMKFNMKNSLDFVGVQNINKIYYILDALSQKKIFFKVEQCFAILGSSFITSSNLSDPVKKQVHAIESIPANIIDNVSQNLKNIKDYYFNSAENTKSEKFLFYKQKKFISPADSNESREIINKGTMS